MAFYQSPTIATFYQDTNYTCCSLNKENKDNDFIFIFKDWFYLIKQSFYHKVLFSSEIQRRPEVVLNEIFIDHYNKDNDKNAK